ncbi:toxin-activating lysine-acyltransferase [Methylocystis parvus]|uniref:RTX toxin-activating lysine-acyltransferase n=2 Tax=Methylocystis parvus TaxID=134 RepID=A0A6B8MA24_9HYPH|nr:toxin-activating lysine-acyltransferase [Methylocystis parvus]
MTPDIFKKGNGADSKKAPPSQAASDADPQAAPKAAPAQLSDAQKAKVAKQVAEMRQRIHRTVGQIVLAMSAVPRYRHQSLADLQGLVIEPLLRERIVIAEMAPAKGQSDEAERREDEAQMVAVAIWATVSDAVDAKIREEIKAGIFPIRLKPEEWTSGDKAWLLDVIAPSQKLASAVLANFRQVVKEGDMRIHPIVARMVDPELLKRLAASSGSQETKAE